jgi:hypothetical protein
MLMAWATADIGERQDDDREARRPGLIESRRDDGGLVAGLSAIRAPDWLVRMNLGDLRAARRHGRQHFRQPIEAITLAGHRDDEARLLGIRLDLAPQPADQHIDASVEGLELPVERCVQEHVPAQGATRPGDEDPQQRKLAVGQRNRLARLTG